MYPSVVNANYMKHKEKEVYENKFRMNKIKALSDNKYL